MAQLISQVDTSGEAYQLNQAHHQALAEDLQALSARIALGGDERSRERHISRGKLLPRDRVNRLLDPGSPFLELGQLGGHEVHDDWIPGAGIITGIGQVVGQGLSA